MFHKSDTYGYSTGLQDGTTRDNLCVYVIFMSECFACMYEHTPHVCSAHEGQKTDHLEGVTVNYRVFSGNQV